MSRKETLTELIQPVVESLGVQFWGIELLSQGRNSVLRIYIDNPNGVMVEDCEKVSRQVSSVLDVEDPITGHYTLEVSSPGMDRLLFTIEQCQSYIGSEVALRLQVAFEGKRKITGQLVGVENDELIVAIEDDEYVLPFEIIDKARVVPSF